LEKKNQSLLENSDLEHLWSALLEQVQDDPSSNGRISYQQFVNTRHKLSEKIQDYFSPSLFLKFEKDEKGRISIINFFQFCMRKGLNIYDVLILCAHSAAFYRTRISINLYDSDGKGYLTENVSFFVVRIAIYIYIGFSNVYYRDDPVSSSDSKNKC
jgi:Ca2+-binding EF-hand superfamily protein